MPQILAVHQDGPIVAVGAYGGRAAGQVGGAGRGQFSGKALSDVALVLIGLEPVAVVQLVVGCLAAVGVPARQIAQPQRFPAADEVLKVDVLRLAGHLGDERRPPLEDTAAWLDQLVGQDAQHVGGVARLPLGHAP